MSEQAASVNRYPSGRWQTIETDDHTIHVHLLDGGHQIDGRDCWCEPELEQNGEMTVVIHKDFVLAQLN